MDNSGSAPPSGENAGTKTASTEVKPSTPTTPSPAQSNETNGNAKKPQQPPRGKQPAAGAAPAQGADGESKLSNAELKKRKQAEKQAKRAAEKAAAQAQAPPNQPSTPGRRASQSQGSGIKTLDLGKHHKKGGPDAQGKALPIRQSGAQAGNNQAAADIKQKKRVDEKKVSIFGHLYGQPRRTSMAGAGKEVHPAVLALGLQMRDYVICGSNARCVAMLLCFKRVIQSYTTPTGTSLTRHLTTHLSHQITYLTLCRPLSISQGNSIRWLKLRISTIDPSTPEPAAKEELCEAIDSFIREKVTVADQVIAKEAANKIQNGDVILTYAKSSIVEKTIIEAYRAGKKFRVIVVDSRPLFEGRNLARSLANVGIDVQYTLTNGISHAVKDATKVFLGAHAMMSNGRLYSRVGTALVAMMAKEKGDNLPVIVCCETVKFTGRVALDSIVMNEIASPDDLVESEDENGVITSTAPDPQAKEAASKGGKKGSKDKQKSDKGGGDSDDDDSSSKGKKGLQGWRDQPNLQLLNIMYDVTPAEYLDMVITELGSLPPSAVPVVHRLSDEKGA